jgi:hypothetical protein
MDMILNITIACPGGIQTHISGAVVIIQCAGLMLDL